MPTLQFKRGAAAGIPTLAAGEPGWTTDTQALYIGTGAGNVLIGPISSYTDEQAQDAVGSILTDTDTIDLAYNDGANTISANARLQMSLTSDASGIKLSGDATTPGNNYFYGTNGSGTKGWYAVGTGSSPLTTKGDIYTYTSVDARLAVGSDGYVLMADSVTSTGLKWSGSDTDGHCLKNTSGTIGWAYPDASKLTGTVPVGNGGTGLTTVADNDLLIGDSGNVITTLAEPSVESVLHYDSGTIDWQSVSSFATTIIGAGSPLTTKGDVWVYSTTNTRLPVGADGSILMADSGETVGLKWRTYLLITKTSAPADGDLSASQAALWFDDTTGAAKLMIKAKNASGTVVTGSVSLS